MKWPKRSAAPGGSPWSLAPAAGGELVRLPVDSKNPIVVVANAGRLAETARGRGVNLIHARSRAPAWSALFAARQLKLPFVTTYHGVYNARSPLKRFYNSVMAKGDLVIANSEYTRAHVLREHHLDPNRVVAIPRGVDLVQFDPDRIDRAAVQTLRASWELEPGDARCVVILPARLTRWKGQVVLIEAAARIEARRPGRIKVILAGDSQGREGYLRELNTLIERLGLREAVAVVGHLGQIQTALAASDIAVFPSTEPEAFGRGAVEAQAMGVPVVAANHGGLSETVVQDETGLLVTPGDPEALAAGIERLVDAGPDGRASMGLRGRDRVRRLYAKTALQASTLQVYDRLLNRALGAAA